MHIDPMMTMLLHRVATERAVARAEQCRVIAERAAAGGATRRAQKMRARTPVRRLFRKNVETREA